MASNIVPQSAYSFASNTIRGDGLVNATALATAYRNTTGIRKDVANWLKTKEAKDSIAYLARATGIPVAQLVDVENGVGTWLHPDLAEILAQWISVEYRFAVVDLIRQSKAGSPAGYSIPQQTHIDKEILLQSLRVETARIVGDLTTLHGRELAMAAIGCSDQIVKVETVVTEVVQPITGRCDRILTADQLKAAVCKRSGQKLKSMKQFVDRVKAKGRDDLLVPVTRNATSEYVAADRLDEAIRLVYGDERQELLKPRSAMTVASARNSGT